jgi:hypothetical protein
MWAVIPSLPEQPVIELVPNTTSGLMFGFPGTQSFFEGYGPRFTNTEETFFFQDAAVGAVHFRISLSAAISGTASAQERVRVQLGERYSFVIRSKRHTPSTDGAIGDAIMLRNLISQTQEVFYFEAALQDKGVDVESMRIHLGTVLTPSYTFCVSTGFFFDDDNKIAMYANILLNDPQGRLRSFGSNTYSMRLAVDEGNSWDGDRSITISRNSDAANMNAAAAHAGPLHGWRPFQLSAVDDRRARAGACVASLRSPALNFAVPAILQLDVPRVDSAGDTLFDWAAANLIQTFSVLECYAAAIPEHPDGLEAFAKPDVLWNSNIGTSLAENERLARISVDFPTKRFLSRFQDGIFRELESPEATSGFLLTTDGNANNEYIGSRSINWIFDYLAELGELQTFVKMNAVIAINATEVIANLSSLSFDDVALQTTYFAEVLVTVVRDDGVVVRLFGGTKTLTPQEAAEILAGNSVVLVAPGLGLTITPAG